MKFLKSLFKKVFSKKPKPLPPTKDPDDFTLTEGATSWNFDYYCPNCKETVGRSEKTTDVCNSCGGIFPGYRAPKRTFRQIFNGQKWIWQYRHEKSVDNLGYRYNLSEKIIHNPEKHPFNYDT